MKQKQSSIFKRLILFFTIIVLPVILIGSTFQWYSVHSVRSLTLQNASERITDLVQAADDKFAETNTLSASLLSDSRIRRTANPEDPMSVYERMMNVNFIRDTLSNIRLSNSHINNVRLHFPLSGITYNADNVFDYNTQTYLGDSALLSDDQLQELLSLRIEKGNLHLYHGNLVFVQYSSWSNPQIIAETVYAIPDLKNLFQDMMPYQDSLYFFLPTGTDLSISNCEDPTLWEQLSSLSNLSAFHWQGQRYYLFRQHMDTVDADYFQLIPDAQLFPGLAFSTLYSIAYTAAILLFSFLFAWSVFRIIKTPLDTMSQKLKAFQNRRFDTRIDPPALSDFNPLYDSFNQMAEQLDTLIQKEFQQTLLLEKAQMKQLQAQINPHFLYNSFFTLSQMIARDMKEPATELAEELGSYFRFIVRDSQDELPLSQEYAHARVYANIQALRFDGRIRITLEELPKEAADLTVPRLILQPLLENAFQHGLKEKIRGGILKMYTLPSATGISIIVEDNGDSLTQEALQSLQEHISQAVSGTLQGDTTGLLNIARRLKLYYSRDDLMQASRSDMGGLKLTIFLPDPKALQS